MRRTEKRRSPVVVFGTVLAAFIYGVTVGHYGIFPFKSLKVAKAALTGTVSHAAARPLTHDRRVNIRNRAAIQREFNSPADIVMVGDSITDYAEWSDIFPGISISNRGIAGDTTKGVLARLDTVIATGATKALIMVGVNDIDSGVPAETVFADYRKIVETLQANGIRPYIQSTTMLGDARKDQNVEINKLNNMLKRFAKRQDLQFIDLNAKLASNGVLEERFTSDSIHLNAAGYREWKALIEPIIVRRAATRHPDVQVGNAESKPSQ